MNTKDVVINKLIFEGRYDTSLLVYENIGRIQKDFQKQFPNVNIEVGEKVTLHNGKRSLYASVNNVGVEFNDGDTEEFIKISERLTKHIYSVGEIGHFKRFGVRIEYLYPLPSYTSEIKRAAKKLFWENSISHLGKEINGLGWVILTKEQDILTRFRFDYVRKINKTIDENKPDYALMADVDRYITGKLGLELCLKHLHRDEAETRKKVSNFLNTLLS